MNFCHAALIVDAVTLAIALRVCAGSWPKFFYNPALHAYSEFGFIWGRVVFRVTCWNRKAVTRGVHVEWWRAR